jgi:hypothetical protein
LLAPYPGRLPPQIQISAPAVADSRPPAGAKYLLLLFHKKYREGLLSDFEEEYRTVVFPQYGAFRAKLYYWMQVLSCFLPVLWWLLEKLNPVFSRVALKIVQRR